MHIKLPLRSRLAALAVALSVSALVGACGSRSAGASTPVTQAPAPDGHVILQSWLVAGPLPSPDLRPYDENGPRRAGYDRDYLTAIGGETGANIGPGTNITVDGEDYGFGLHSWDEPYLDLRDLYGSDARVAAYLYGELNSETERDVYLHAGTNDAGKIWVGGKLVVAYPHDRGASRSQNVVRVTLPAGRTPVLMKIDQAGGGWGAYAEFYGVEAHDAFVKEAFPKRLAIEVSDNMPLIGTTISASVVNYPEWPGLDRTVSWAVVDSTGPVHTIPVDGSGTGVSVALPDGPTRTVYVRATTVGPSGEPSTGETAVRICTLDDAFFIAKPKPDHIVLSLGDNGNTDRRVAWRTDAGTEKSVGQLRVSGSSDWITVNGSDYEQDSNRGQYRAHEVTFAGLEPGTRYEYRVGTGNSGNWSDVYTFGIPAPGDPLRIIVLGDSRSRMDVWDDVIHAAAELKPDFIFNTGDLIADGRDMNDWNTWFERAKDVFPEVAFMPTLGNHENQSPNYLASFALPRNADSSDVIEQYYSVDVGPTRWVGLNSELHLGRQSAWMDTLLADDGPQWTFTALHRPAYSGHKSRGDGNLDIRREWSPMFDKYGVDIAWAGHDHFYFRSKSIKGEQVVPDGEGTVYITTGGAGAPLYDIAENKWSAYVEKCSHFVLVEITGDKLEGTVYRSPDGAVIDRFTLTAE